MKKLFSILILCLVVGVSIAQSSDVKRVIKKYDSKYLRTIKANNKPGLFWVTVINNNARIKKIQEAEKNKSKSLNDALISLNYMYANTPQNDYIAWGYDSIKNKLAIDLGIEESVKDRSLIIIDDGNLNASMDAMGQMRIFKGCIDYLSYNELLAVCAHEIAHYACAHVVSRIWKSAKKARTNKMWADIGVSIFMGAMVAASASNAYYGLDNSYIDQITSNADIFYYRGYEYANDATTKYTYRYTRDEETEADILAYRFMECMGYGGENVISMLKKIKTRYGDTPHSKHNSHPSTTFRIQVLEAIRDGYIGNK